MPEPTIVDKPSEDLASLSAPILRPQGPRRRGHRARGPRPRGPPRRRRAARRHDPPAHHRRRARARRQDPVSPRSCASAKRQPTRPASASTTSGSSARAWCSARTSRSSAARSSRSSSRSRTSSRPSTRATSSCGASNRASSRSPTSRSRDIGVDVSHGQSNADAWRMQLEQIANAGGRHPQAARRPRVRDPRAGTARRSACASAWPSPPRSATTPPPRSSSRCGPSPPGSTPCRSITSCPAPAGGRITARSWSSSSRARSRCCTSPARAACGRTPARTGTTCSSSSPPSGRRSAWSRRRWPARCC